MSGGGHSPPRLVDNSRARPMEIPFAWQNCTTSAALYPFEAINMYLASPLISVLSVLNFSLSALLAVTLGIPLTVASPSNFLPARGVRCGLYSTLAFGWLAWDAEVKQGISD